MTGGRCLELDMFVSGCVPRHGGESGIGCNEGGGVGVGGGVKEMQVHTGDEKTTKRWEADDRARDRLKIDG